MKITAIGTGSAFSNKNFNACFMLEENDSRMLIDCGFQIPAALNFHKIDIKSITDIYISHAHADHVGGLEALAFQRYDWIKRPTHWSERGPECKAPRLLANERLLEDLWTKSLKGGLESLEGLDAELETYFECRPIPPNHVFFWNDWQFRPVQTVHIMTGSVISNTFGLIITKDGHKTIYITTDSQHCSPRQVEIFYRQADIIFQDCEMIGVDPIKKICKFYSGVHANYAQLVGYPSVNSVVLSSEIRSKMNLIHYQDFVTDGKDFFGNECDWDSLARADGFSGICRVGNVYEI